MDEDVRNNSEEGKSLPDNLLFRDKFYLSELQQTIIGYMTKAAQNVWNDCNVKKCKELGIYQEAAYFTIDRSKYYKWLPERTVEQIVQANEKAWQEDYYSKEESERQFVKHKKKEERLRFFYYPEDLKINLIDGTVDFRLTNELMEAVEKRLKIKIYNTLRISFTRHGYFVMLDKNTLGTICFYKPQLMYSGKHTCKIEAFKKADPAINL